MQTTHYKASTYDLYTVFHKIGIPSFTAITFPNVDRF